MSINLNPPPILRGDEKAQLMQIRSYLYQMQEQLQFALEQVTPETLAKAISEQATTEQLPDDTAPTLAAAYTKLKSIIIKTAHTIETEMDTLVTNFESTYLAQSTFGTFQENLSNTITQGADAVVQNYGYDSKLSAVSDNIIGLEGELGGINNALEASNTDIFNIKQYNITSEQYIKTGLLYFDDDSVPRYGVAVGEKLTTIVVNGETVIERSGLAATFTSDRLSFWQNEVEVAYISNNQLYIAEVTVLTRLFLGDWVLDRSNGFMIKWVGV